MSNNQRVHFEMKSRRFLGHTDAGMAFDALKNEYRNPSDQVEFIVTDLLLPLAKALHGGSEVEVEAAISESKAQLEQYYRKARNRITRSTKNGYGPVNPTPAEPEIEDEGLGVSEDDNELEELDYD